MRHATKGDFMFRQSFVCVFTLKCVASTGGLKDAGAVCRAKTTSRNDYQADVSS